MAREDRADDLVLTDESMPDVRREDRDVLAIVGTAIEVPLFRIRAPRARNERGDPPFAFGTRRRPRARVGLQRDDRRRRVYDRTNVANGKPA